MAENHQISSMDDLLAPYIRLTEADRLPHTPRVRVCMEAPPRLSTTLPYDISFYLQREDDDPRDCRIIWNAALYILIPSNLILFRHITNPDGGLELERVDVGPDPTAGNFPIVGLRTPGAVVEEELPKLVMPGGSRLGFAAEMEAVPWPGREEHEARLGFASANDAERVWRWGEAEKRRAPDFVKASERVPGTPILVVTLDCPRELTLRKSRPGSSTFEVRAKVTYDAPASEKPITFRTCDLWHSGSIGLQSRREGYEFYKYHKLDEGSDEQEWQVCEMDDDEGGCGIFDFDGPDIEVHIREESDFISLRPGEFWTTAYQVQIPTYTRLPKDTKVGDRFRYQFLGASGIDWWDWGHLENEHAETVVTLPSWRGRVIQPADNGGRPRLVVPASDPVEFRVVG
ncbi:hypothetical protein F5144DRAFT_493499 [Chaetomium tenue]|uniref:Uncharacterized protein n=1 Tax=Chaetomium tenue TaxID=1854479 RepID=A0ACB7P6P9_9PEZI|nr:hypothetical protein F5144DRAFT_493499 [Chaetomium globosum]